MEDIDTICRDAPLERLCNAILLSAMKKAVRRLVIRRSPAFITVEFECGDEMVDEMHPPLKLFDAIVDRFALMANISAQPKRGRSEGTIHLLLGQGRDSYHPIVIEGHGDERRVSLGCFSEAEWREELELELERAEAHGQVDRTRLGHALQRLVDHRRVDDQTSRASLWVG